MLWIRRTWVASHCIQLWPMVEVGQCLSHALLRREGTTLATRDGLEPHKPHSQLRHPWCKKVRLIRTSKLRTQKPLLILESLCMILSSKKNMVICFNVWRNSHWYQNLNWVWLFISLEFWIKIMKLKFYAQRTVLFYSYSCI